MCSSHKGFKKFGKGVYTCNICERRTRENGQSNDEICLECYDLAGLENMLSDEGADYCRENGVIKERDELIRIIVERGGKKENLLHEFKWLMELEV